MNLIEEGSDAQLVFVRASLSSELKQALHDLLKEYKDVIGFWLYQAYPTANLASQYRACQEKNGQICCCVDFRA